MDSTKLRVYLALAEVAGIFLIIRLLVLLLQREWVKDDLARRGITPLSVRWRPFSPGWGSNFGAGFRVIYVDELGLTHRAYGWVWERRNKVRWTRDEVIAESNRRGR